MKLAAVCIVLLSLAAASYATPYRFGERQEQQVEEQMMDRPDDSQDVMDEIGHVLQQLKENQAKLQEDVGQAQFLGLLTSLLG